MEYDVKLTQQELQVIYQGLGELPLKLALNMFAKLQQLQQRQDAEKAVPLESHTDPIAFGLDKR